MIGMNLVQIITGLIVGIGLGYLCYYVRHTSKSVKFLICVFMSIMVPIVSEVSTFHESKYICIIFFGWACYRVWGEEKPEHELATLWMLF